MARQTRITGEALRAANARHDHANYYNPWFRMVLEMFPSIRAWMRPTPRRLM